MIYHCANPECGDTWEPRHVEEDVGEEGYHVPALVICEGDFYCPYCDAHALETMVCECGHEMFTPGPGFTRQPNYGDAWNPVCQECWDGAMEQLP